MQDFAVTLLEQAQAYSVAEALAVVLAVLYLILAIQQNIWCWVCAALSTAIFASLFFGVALYMEAALNVFYFAMAVYGWMQWNNGARDSQPLPVSVWPLRLHLFAIATVVAVSLLSGYLLDSHTDAAFPYIDSLTSWGAVWATFLVARKVLENWWYWLLIDATMVYVFWAKNLEFTAVLYVVYLLLIPVGLLSWTRSYRQATV
jgi:nicotinamide mononucleotide transporter